MGKFECEKGSTLWKLWADLFLLWREYGDVKSLDDANDFYLAARRLDDKYKNTAEGDLCRAITITMGEVIDKRWVKAHGSK